MAEYLLKVRFAGDALVSQISLIVLDCKGVAEICLDH